MTGNTDGQSSQTKQQEEQEEESNTPYPPYVGVREKLIFIFLIVKIVPLILLAFIAWQALKSLGITLRTTAVTDSRSALTVLATEGIERLTTDAAQKVAKFLYSRDTDISFLADYCGYRLAKAEESLQEIERMFADFSGSKTSHIRWHGDWTVGEDGMTWVQTNPYIPQADTEGRSTNEENNEKIDGSTFRYRPPYGFGDSPDRFVSVPLYDEIALLDKNGMQIAKYVTPHSTKKRFPLPRELLDVSDPKNTFVKAEHYFEELQKLSKGSIYVSDVIGAYTPSRFIGMYTPDFLASKRIDAKIAELKAEEDKKNAEIIWKLRVLNAELKNDEAKFNSRIDINNKEVRDEIDRRLGKGQIWKIERKTLFQASDELKTLGFPELAAEILNIPFKPEEEAFAGAENPVGIRFEGIVRWAKPVLDEHGEVAAYVTFALNHDHLLEMIDHITPMSARYTELSDAFDGNYAFIWDYKCRSIVHPRHHSICGYNPATGLPETPWLEKTLYDGMIAANYDRADWQKYIATLTDYIPWAGNKDSLAYQSRGKSPAPELTAQGLVGLDGRYLNNAPQCTGWMDLTRDGGSGSFYIFWSGLYKLTTAATIPYYTGQYSPEVQGNRRGFGFVAIGAGIDDFSRPANEMGNVLNTMIAENIQQTTLRLVWTTIALSVIVICIAIWMASYLSQKLQWLIDGITKFRQGHREFRFAAAVKDEFGLLAHSFDEMAENIVHSIHTPLIITDMDLKIIYANEQSLDIFGITKLDNLVGQSYKDRSIYNFGSKHCPVTALNKGREPEVMYLKQTDSYLLGTANYLMDENGEKQGYIITSNDVTELSRKQVELEHAKEEAELASQHKSRFLWRMSHELRTPMNAMLGLNDILQSKISHTHELDSNSEISDYLMHMKTASLDLLNLLNDVLEASNLESGTIKLVDRPLNMPDMLEELSVKARSECAAKQLKFTTHIEELSVSSFLADGVQLRQVLNSMFSNAVKYTPAGGSIDFIVRQKDRKDGKSLLVFAVRDTGIGIAPDKIESIFHPFERLESEEGSFSGGNGLGLTIIQKVLTLFGTQINIQSEPGKGSEFFFEVWLQEDNRAVKAKPENTAARFTGQRALVIDDMRLNRLVLVNFLTDSGFLVDEAKDGKEGLEMFENSPENTYDIVFMDIQMPVMDGYKSAEAIRALPRQDAKTVPIVTISANAYKADRDKSLASGMNAHYAKPIQKEIFSEILREFCTPTNE